MMNDLVEGMIETDEERIQVLWYQWSKRVDALTARVILNDSIVGRENTLEDCCR